MKLPLLRRYVTNIANSTSELRARNPKTNSAQSLSLRTKAVHHRVFKQKDDDEEDDEEIFDGRAKFQLHKSRGQHILTNPRVLDSIVRRAQVLPTDTVLEIGPGTGNLTVRLLESAREVVCVEIDGRMVDALRKRVENLGLQDRLTILAADALKADLPQFDLCVSNIPYGISSPLIAKLLLGPSKHSFRSATLLLQKEFAQRLVAKPGDSEFNRLAVNIGLLANVELLMNVSKKDFVPSPKVDSSLVRICKKSNIPEIDLNEWLAFTRTCFGKRNKTLGAIFKQKKKIAELFRRKTAKANDFRLFEEDLTSDQEDEREEDAMIEELDGRNDVFEVGQFKEKIVGILQSRGVDEKRPSKMSHEELLELLQLFNQEGILFND